MSKSSNTQKRFWAKVQKTDSCWNWTGCFFRKKGKKTYGCFQNRAAHRFSYELEKGKVPDGLTIDHLCENKACVNPEHLECVTQLENVNRYIKNHSTFNPETVKRCSFPNCSNVGVRAYGGQKGQVWRKKWCYRHNTSAARARSNPNP